MMPEESSTGSLWNRLHVTVADEEKQARILKWGRSRALWGSSGFAEEQSGE